MTDWVCRSCDGGFPNPIVQQATWKCPWCGEPIAKWAQEYGKREVGKMVDGSLNGANGVSQ